MGQPDESHGADAFVERVRVRLLQELGTFEGAPVVLALRVDDVSPERSAFAVAQLPHMRTAVVARVYESDLDGGHDLSMVYMSLDDDVDLALEVLTPSRSGGPGNRRS